MAPVQVSEDFTDAEVASSLPMVLSWVSCEN